MMMLREVRILTALAVIVLALLPLQRAVTVLGFGVAEARATADKGQAELASYLNQPLVSARARRVLLRLAPPASPDELAEQLSSLLAETPMSGAGWLDLAVARLGDGAGIDKIAESLALSVLTSANEAALMAGRASFGLPLWAALPPDSRRGLVIDLIGGWPVMASGDRHAMRAVIANASEPQRRELAAGLLLAGKYGTNIAKALELELPAQGEAPKKR